MKKSLPNYLHVFEYRLNDLRKRIEKEMELPKKERSRHTLKKIVTEARKLRNKIKDVRDEHAKHCPHCGGKLYESICGHLFTGTRKLLPVQLQLQFDVRVWMITILCLQRNSNRQARWVLNYLQLTTTN